MGPRLNGGPNSMERRFDWAWETAQPPASALGAWDDVVTG